MTNPATKTATTWRDLIPALRPERGVPVVVHRIGGRRGLILGDASSEDGETAGTRWVRVLWDGAPEAVEITPRLLAVDLDDSQGFAWALRRWWMVAPGLQCHALEGRMAAVWWRHMTGNTDDADRLALATALAEVTS